MDTFGDHTLHCKEIHDFKYIHDFVRYVLLDILRRTRLLVKKETLVNFLLDSLDEGSALTPTDVMVYR